jgi:Sulfotransferase family
LSDAPVDLSVPGLLAEARAQAGLEDFGDPSFREGLDVLVETYATTARLSPAGRKRTRRRLVQLLATRLRVQAAWQRHPEVRALEIRRPVYLTGLPRTGTSALFNLLGADPHHRPLLLWEGLFPDPLEGLAPGAPDPRREALRKLNERDRAKNPEFDKIHYVTVDMPEECVLLLAHTFCDAQMGIEPLMEPYAGWFQRQDLRASYRYYADLLRLLQWQRPGERWLLKSPAHLWALDVLVELFPDACLLWTHRSPLEMLGSYCSMMAMLMNIRESFDPKELGPTVLEYLARSLERGLAARERIDAGRFFDVDYRAFVADALGTVRRAYEHFGLELDPAASAALETWAREHPQGKHGAHRYSLEEYGLSAEAARERLAFYIDRFDVG